MLSPRQNCYRRQLGKYSHSQHRYDAFILWRALEPAGKKITELNRLKITQNSGEFVDVTGHKSRRLISVPQLLLRLPPIFFLETVIFMIFNVAHLFSSYLLLALQGLDV